MALAPAVVGKALLRCSAIQLHTQRARLVPVPGVQRRREAGHSPRRFAEAYESGAPVPFVPGLGEPKSQRRLIPPADRALFSFMLEIEVSKRAYGRAHADGLSLSAIMRRFVIDYVRRERAARPPGPEPGGAPVQPKPMRVKGDQAA